MAGNSDWGSQQQSPPLVLHPRNDRERKGDERRQKPADQRHNHQKANPRVIDGVPSPPTAYVVGKAANQTTSVTATICRNGDGPMSQTVSAPAAATIRKVCGTAPRRAERLVTAEAGRETTWTHPAEPPGRCGRPTGMIPTRQPAREDRDHQPEHGDGRPLQPVLQVGPVPDGQPGEVRPR